MRRYLILGLVCAMIVLALAGCRQAQIINGTSVGDNGDNGDNGNNMSVPSAESNHTENQAANIDEVVVSISNSESNDSSNDNVDITGVLVDDKEEEPEAMAEPEGTLKVNFIDVGYGDSILVLTPKNGSMLIDGGDNDCGSRLTKILRDAGLFYYLDVMIATNPSTEHIGGLDSILFNMMQVSEIYDNGEGSDRQDYFQFHEMANNKGMFITPSKDIQIPIGDDDSVKVNLITPYKGGYFNNTGDNSIVVKMDYGGVSFLFMSDCSYQCERRLEGYDLKADILKVGNYGVNSTSDEFLDWVDPKVAIVSVDEKDCSNFNTQVIDRMKSRGIKVLRTDQNGTITVESDGKTYSVSTQR